MRSLHRAPTHPGTILAEEFLKPKGFTLTQVAGYLRVPPRRMTGLISGKQGVTAELAWGLADLLGTTPEFWMNLQTAWDLYHAARQHGREPAIAR